MESFDDILFTKDGEFSKIYKSIRTKISADQLDKLSNSSSEQKIKFLATLPLPQFKVSACRTAKNLEKALEFKELGNEQFRLNQFGEAYNLYTKALLNCPVDEDNPTDPNNKQFSIFLANRSAALDKAGLYAACIKDIDTALKFGYPRDLWYKIYKRKGHALIKMKQYLLAREALEMSLKNIGRSDIKKEKDRDNYRMRVRKQMTVFNVTKELYNVDVYTRHPSVLADGQPEDRGLCDKVCVAEEGGKRQLVAKQDIKCEDVLLAVDPYVAVVNVSGGRAGGKICPHKIEKMFRPVPCKFGVEEVFGSEEAREEANNSYHQYEWSILSNLRSVGLIERARLALRMVTTLKPSDVSRVLSLVEKKEKAEQEGNETKDEEKEKDPLNVAIKTLSLPISAVSVEEMLVASLVSQYLTNNLAVSGYISSGGPKEDDVFSLLYRAVLVALRHTRPIEILEVPKNKQDILDNDIGVSICGYGIYPDLPGLEAVSTGAKSDVIRWFVDKKMVLSAYKQIESGGRVVLFAEEGGAEPSGEPTPNNMITFRCANELCSNSFPLKENTKEKIIACPLEECGLKTNIWERLKLIQRLKKDTASAKEEFSRDGEEFGRDGVEMARDIIKDTIEEWDRILIRPYREVTQLENMYIKALQCVIGDTERRMVEGNQMGHIINYKKKASIYPTKEEEEELKSAIVKI